MIAPGKYNAAFLGKMPIAGMSGADPAYNPCETASKAALKQRARLAMSVSVKTSRLRRFAAVAVTVLGLFAVGVPALTVPTQPAEAGVVVRVGVGCCGWGGGWWGYRPYWRGYYYRPYWGYYHPYWRAHYWGWRAHPVWCRWHRCW